jgi:hypothetical protein
MNPACPTSNNNIPYFLCDNTEDEYEFIEDIYYKIKYSGVNIFLNKNEKRYLLGQTDGYQTRPTCRVSGGVFVVENDKHYLVRGSAYKINDKNYIMSSYSIE